MKKVFLLACLLFSTLLTFAQIKKVAILEVVDREGRLSYSQKLVLRSSMARAVANTLGYEAYDRTDVDMIMSEHDFQRTGLVREDEIRKLGEMTGVSLILVTEGALTDYNNIFVTAKILNVETGKVEMMDNMMMSLNGDGMQQGCTKLTTRLFGVTSNLSAAEKYQIIRKGSSYVYAGRQIDKYDYVTLLQNNCPKAYQYYKQGRVLSTTGWVIFALSPVMIAAGSVMITDYNLSVAYAGIGLLSVGCVGMTCVSIPLLAVGYTKQHKSVNIYNQRCAQTPISPIVFNITAGQNGLGLALRF